MAFYHPLFRYIVISFVSRSCANSNVQNGNQALLLADEEKEGSIAGCAAPVGTLLSEVCATPQKTDSSPAQ